MSYVLIVKGLDEQQVRFLDKKLRQELRFETVTVTAEMFELVTKGPKREQLLQDRK